MPLTCNEMKQMGLYKIVNRPCRFSKTCKNTLSKPQDSNPERNVVAEFCKSKINIPPPRLTVVMLPISVTPSDAMEIGCLLVGHYGFYIVLPVYSCFREQTKISTKILVVSETIIFAVLSVELCEHSHLYGRVAFCAEK